MACVYRFDLLAPLNQDHPDPLLLLLLHGTYAHMPTCSIA
jgi:hypothetical protein